MLRQTIDICWKIKQYSLYQVYNVEEIKVCSQIDVFMTTIWSLIELLIKLIPWSQVHLIFWIGALFDYKLLNLQNNYAFSISWYKFTNHFLR